MLKDIFKKKNWDEVDIVERPRKVIPDDEFNALSKSERDYILEKEVYNKKINKIKRFISKFWRLFIVIFLVIAAIVLIGTLTGAEDVVNSKIYEYNESKNKPTEDFYKLLDEAAIEYDLENVSNDYLKDLEFQYQAKMLRPIEHNKNICNLDTTKVLKDLKNSDFAKVQDYLDNNGTGCNLLYTDDLLMKTSEEMGAVLYIKEAAEKSEWDDAQKYIDGITSPYLKVVMTLFMPNYIQHEMWGTNTISFDNIDDIDIKLVKTEEDVTQKLFWLYYFEINDKNTDTKYLIKISTDGYYSEMESSII